MKHFTHKLNSALLLLLGVMLGWSAPAMAQESAEELPRQLQGVNVDEKLGETVSLKAEFKDENGKTVTMGDYLGDKPVLLTLNYYNCEMLCSLQLNGLLDGLGGLEWTAGDEFRIVTISIDHREGPELASKKREAYLDELGRGDVDWSFLTGSRTDIQLVANSVGFGYRYDPEQDQFAHIAAVMFLSPEGKITRYLYGLEYRPFDLKMALQEAADGQIGDTVDKVIFSCFHYDPTLGRYDIWAFGVMRLGGIVIVVLLAGFLGFLWWREVRKKRVSQTG